MAKKTDERQRLQAVNTKVTIDQIIADAKKNNTGAPQGVRYMVSFLVTGTIAGAPVVEPTFTIQSVTGGNIPLPFKRLALTRVSSQFFFLFAANGNQSQSHSLEIVASGNSETIPFGILTNANSVVTPDPGNVLMSFSGSESSGTGDTSNPSIQDTPPYRFFATGFQLIVKGWNNTNFSIGASYRYRVDLLFDVLEK